MTQYEYSLEEINDIKSRLDSLIGEFLMTENNNFCIVTKYTIGEKEITEGFFKKKKVIAYYISSIEICFGKDNYVTHTSENFCNHITVGQFLHMKEAAEILFRKLKKFELMLSK